MTDQHDNDTAVVKPFAAFLREHGGGRSHDELSESLHKVIDRVRETGKKGSLTYTVTIAPFKGDTTTLEVSDEIKTKLPEFDRPARVWFAGDDGNLVRDDPRQPTIEGLQIAPDPTAGQPMRHVQ